MRKSGRVLIFLCPLLAASCGLSLVVWHWIYLGVALLLLAVAYVLFKMKYYHLHEEYLASLKIIIYDND